VSRRSNEPVTEASAPLRRGYVQLYTGDGKGKTTAAIGLAVRAAGAGLRVFIAQFIKEGRYSEIQALECFGERITCRQYGRGRWIRGQASEDDASLARNGLDDVRAVLTSGRYQVVILDEALLAVWMRMLDVDELLDLVDLKPDCVELVLTGRRADPRLVERADLVTEMREVKHYYRQGVRAREGIES